MKTTNIEGIIEKSKLSGVIPELLGNFSQEEIERLLKVAGLELQVKYNGALKTVEGEKGPFGEVVIYGIRGFLYPSDSNNVEYAQNPRVGWQLKFPEPVPLDSILKNATVNGKMIEIRVNGTVYSINKITGALSYPNR